MLENVALMVLVMLLGGGAVVAVFAGFVYYSEFQND